MEHDSNEPTALPVVDDATSANHEVKLSDEDATHMTPLLKKKLVYMVGKMFGLEKDMAEVVFDTAMSLRRAIHQDSVKSKKR